MSNVQGLKKELLLIVGLFFSCDMLWWWHFLKYEPERTIVLILGAVILAVACWFFYREDSLNKWWRICFIMSIIMLCFYAVYFGIVELSQGLIKIPSVEKLWFAAYNSEMAVLPEEYVWFRNIIMGVSVGEFVSNVLLVLFINVALLFNGTVKNKKSNSVIFTASVIFTVLSKLIYIMEIKFQINIIQHANYKEGYARVICRNTITIEYAVAILGLIMTSVLISNMYIHDKALIIK